MSQLAGRFQFTWSDGGVVMTWRKRFGTGTLNRRFEPTVGEWNALWTRLDEEGAWAPPPPSRSQLEDAARTQLELEVGGRVVTYSTQGPWPTTSIVREALEAMRARADGGVVIAPEEPVSDGDGY